MENGDETLAHRGAEMVAPNGGFAEEEATVTVTAAKSYAAVAANAEIEDLRAAKLDLEEKLAAADIQNKDLAAEAHRLEGIFYQARDDVATAEHFAAVSGEKVDLLQAEVKRLQDLIKVEKCDREADKRNSELLAAELEAVRQVKLKLEKEIEALKASSAAAVTAEEKEAAPANEPPKEAKVAWQGMAAAAAAGAAATAAFVLIYLRLKRR